MNAFKVTTEQHPLLSVGVAFVGGLLASFFLRAIILPDVLAAAEGLASLIERRGEAAAVSLAIAVVGLVITSAICLMAILVVATALCLVRKMDIAVPLALRSLHQIDAFRNRRATHRNRAGKVVAIAQRQGSAGWASAQYGRPVRQVVSPIHTEE